MIKMRLLHICKMKNNLFFCKNSERIYAKDHTKYAKDHKKICEGSYEICAGRGGAGFAEARSEARPDHCSNRRGA